MLCRRECLVRWGRWRHPGGRHALGRPAVQQAVLRAASTAASAPAGERREAYLHMKSTIPLLDETIGQVLQRTAAKFPERVAVTSHYQNQRITFNELIKKVGRIVQLRLKEDIRKCDVFVVDFHRQTSSRLGCWPWGWPRATEWPCGGPTRWSGWWSRWPWRGLGSSW